MCERIKDLKVGDKVIVSRLYCKEIGIVEKITPAGNIRVNGILFTPSGFQRGSNIWDRAHLCVATPEDMQNIIDENTYKKAIRLMRETSNITLEQAKGIIALLEKGGEE